MSEEIDKSSFLKAVIETAGEHNMHVVVSIEDEVGFQCASYGGTKDVLALISYLQISIGKNPDFFEQP